VQIYAKNDTKIFFFFSKALYPLDLLPAQSDCCRSSFFNFFIFYFSLHSPLDGGIWFQTVEFGSVLECDWKMRFIVPKNHPERKRTSILVEWGRKKLKLIDFLSQSWSAQTNGLGCSPIWERRLRCPESRVKKDDKYSNKTKQCWILKTFQSKKG